MCPKQVRGRGMKSTFRQYPKVSSFFGRNSLIPGTKKNDVLLLNVYIALQGTTKEPLPQVKLGKTLNIYIYIYIYILNFFYIYNK